MRAHFFQHVPFEGLGSIEPWLRSVQAVSPSFKSLENIRLYFFGGGDAQV